jgi:bacterioferritin-associated ferredoxin
LTFFGHDLSCDGVSPNEEVAAVRDAKPPKNAAQVRSFLGLVQYCAKFLPDFAQVAEPIRKLTRKNQQFEWRKALSNSILI